jgi:hypothetical protein
MNYESKFRRRLEFCSTSDNSRIFEESFSTKIASMIHDARQCEEDFGPPWKTANPCPRAVCVHAGSHLRTMEDAANDAEHCNACAITMTGRGLVFERYVGLITVYWMKVEDKLKSNESSWLAHRYAGRRHSVAPRPASTIATEVH